MTYIAASRDALAKALWGHTGEGAGEIADALIASGAVVAADSLADEQRITAVAQAWYEREQPPFGPTTAWDELSAVEQWRWRQSTCDNLRALAAALEERAQ